MNRKHDNYEYLFIHGMYATLSKHGVNLSLENYSANLKNALKMVIFDNNFRCFTSSNHIREEMRKNFNPEFSCNLFALIKYKMGDELFDRMVPSYYEDSFNVAELLNCIDYFVDNILLNDIPKEWMDTRENIRDNNYFQDDIKKVKYFRPNNTCKKAVEDGIQFKLNHSEEKYAGMQAVSDIGKVKKNQEDAYYIGVHPQNNDFKIMLVADGMGGHVGGQYASNIAAKEMLRWFESLNANEFYNSNNDSLQGMIGKQLDYINTEIIKKYPGAGTTLCVAIVKNDNVFMCNIGDSKGFVMQDGKMIYETPTHNFAESCLCIPGDFARFHSRSNVVIENLGIGDGIVSESCYYNTIPLQKGSDYQVVLCSDGVSDCLSQDEIRETVLYSNSENMFKNLVDRALNIKSSFQTELEKSKRKFGIFGKHNFRKLLDRLRRAGMDENYERVIEGGKDNTTAVSGTIRR